MRIKKGEKCDGEPWHDTGWLDTTARSDSDSDEDHMLKVG